MITCGNVGSGMITIWRVTASSYQSESPISGNRKSGLAVETIDRLINREGYTLKGARQAIERGHTGGAAPVATPAAAPAPVADLSVLPQLRAIRQRLAAALAA